MRGIACSAHMACANSIVNRRLCLAMPLVRTPGYVRSTASATPPPVPWQMEARPLVPHDQLNVHGGAIALGHPIGASGTRITVTLLHVLRQHGGTRGLASICHGTGGGVALAVERT